MTDPIFTVGGFWRFTESGMPDGLDDIGSFLARGIEQAKIILRASGVSEGDLLSGVQALRRRVERGSLEDMAVALLASGHLSQTMLWHCTEELAPSADAIKALALHSADFGVKYAVVMTLFGGLTERANLAERVLKGSKNSAKPKREEAALRVMQSYGAKALTLAKEYREKKPEAPKAEIARHLRAHPDADNRGFVLPVGDKAIVTFLGKHGL